MSGFVSRAHRFALGVALASALAATAGCGSGDPADGPSVADAGGTQVAITADPEARQSGDVTPVIIDTDVSLDDVMAILYLLRRPDVDVLAITVSGTLPAGEDPDPRPASEVIATAADSETPPTFIALGPLTNLAQALRDHPDLESNLAGVHLMGGAIDVPGNTIDNPDAEWNLWIDPVADAEVFTTSLPLSLVPLDAANEVPLTEEFVDVLAENLATPEAEAAYAVVRSDPESTNGGLSMWDQLAVVAFVEADVVTWTDLDPEVVSTGGPSQAGALTAGSGRPV